jgi:hypothetical protein
MLNFVVGYNTLKILPTRNNTTTVVMCQTFKERGTDCVNGD